jgi:hypothetical protein
LNPAPPAYGTIIVSDNNAIRFYAPGANGNAAPIRTITGPATGLQQPWAIDLDTAGDVWAANLNGGVTEYAATATGNATPIRTIPPSSPALESPDGIALTPDGKHVWVGNDSSTTITEYPTAAGGGSTPVRSIAGLNTGITWSHDVALSRDGGFLWEADGGSVTLRKFRTTLGYANQTSSRVITTGVDNTNYPEGATVDLAGNVWTSDQQANTIAEYGPQSDTVPTRTVTGAATHITYPSYVSLDARGTVWLAVYGYVPGGPNVPSVEAFSPAASGDTAPLVRIAGAATGLVNPTDVAVFGRTPKAPQSVKAAAGKRRVRVRWHQPSNVRGGLIGYLVRRRNSSHGTWKTLALLGKSTHTYTDTHRHPGHKYRYDVFAYNEFGLSHPSKTSSAVPHR